MLPPSVLIVIIVSNDSLGGSIVTTELSGVDNGLANKIILAGCGRLVQTTSRESFRKQNLYNCITT